MTKVQTRHEPRTAAAPVTSGRLATHLVAHPALVAAVVIVVAFLIIGHRVGNSPDIISDEVVYTKASLNVASHGNLTWQGEPVFVHPPLYFLAQSLWLTVRGHAHSSVLNTIPIAREVTSAFGAVSVGFLFLLALAIFERAPPRRRLFLALTVASLAVFDPVLDRYSRLAMIESLALAVSLMTILIAWRMRSAPSGVWIMIVGLSSGLALLVKEISIFIIITPLVCAILLRSWSLARRALGALGVGILIWATLPVWALALGLGDRFATQKLLTAERLLGILQVTGWNRAGVSFLHAVRTSAPLYAASYILLAVGAGVAVWLFFRRLEPPGAFLLALVLSTYAFGAYTVAKGQLNEQFFVYLMPAAILGTVLAADRILTAIAERARRRGKRRAGVLPVMPVLGLALIVGLGASNWAHLYASGNQQGIARIVAFTKAHTNACDIINASGDAQKYSFLLDGNRVVRYASGPRALDHGVHYFFLNPKDVIARYGVMTPDLASWIQRNATRIAVYPSETYHGAGLWHVPLRPFDPAQDTLPIVGGAFVSVDGSACGGYPIVDAPGAAMYQGFSSLGGKQVLGRPQSAQWRGSGGVFAFQVFDTLVLRSSGTAAARPFPIVRQLMDRFPVPMRAHFLPVGGVPQAATLATLNDPAIAAFYLGVDPRAAKPPAYAAAALRWGRPLSPAATMPDGAVRQAFENVIMERESGSAHVGLATIGPVITRGGLIPASASAPQPEPNLDLRTLPILPSGIRSFLIALLIALELWATTVLALWRRNRTREGAP